MRKAPRIKNPRICAICLDDIEREEYDDHMREIHGYELLDCSPANVKET